MLDSSARRAALQWRVDRVSQPVRAMEEIYASIGNNEIDAVLGGGLARGKLHEIVAAEADDAVSAAGFTAMCARLIGGQLGWLSVGRTGRSLYPPGLLEIGCDPNKLLSVSAPDPPALLRAADEAMRCNALGVVVIELWREPRRIDLTVSRRLLLGAEQSGVTALLLRVAVEPMPNAAQTRWAVKAAPSRPLTADAPGFPAFDLELLRQRGGPAGCRWRMEWDRDRAEFRKLAGLRAQLSGDLAAVSHDGTLADDRTRAAAG